jgi:transcriptional regulator with XRE-family HTH domain
MTLKQIFIRNLKEFRKKEGLSQMKLAEYCNTATSYIGDIEIGRRFPSMELIEKIAGIMRIEPYRFFINRKDNDVSAGVKDCTEDIFPRLPNSMKKQITTQIKSQINRSTSEILSEIKEIIN